MEAIVLVGGRGTRLRPLTLATPKPMLPLAGVPILAHQIARLRDVGVDRVVLATSYLAQDFVAHFGDGASLGLDIEHVTEVEPLGTGGGIRNVADRLRSGPDEPVFVLNGDVLSGHDLSAQLDLHARRAADVTLHLVQVPDARAFGCVPTDPDGRVTDFLEKQPEPVTDQVNAGCYLFARRVVDAIPAGRVVSVERETFPGLLAGSALVMGYVETAYWLDVGTPAAYVRCSADLVTGVLASPVLPGPTGELLRLGAADLAPDAVVTGGSCLGDGASVGAGARVEASVLGAGARVEAGAVVVRSVVGPGAVVGPDCSLTDTVVGDRAELGRAVELVAGARVWPDVVLAERAVRFSSDA